MKTVALTAGEAARSLRALIDDHSGEGLYLHRVHAGAETFYTDIADRLLSLADETPVQLVFYTESELTQDTVADAIRFTDRWTRQLPGIADALYAGQGSINALVQLAEALVWLREVSAGLARRRPDMAAWPPRLEALVGELLRVTEGNNASEQADFLLYEVLETLDELLNRFTDLALPGGDPA